MFSFESAGKSVKLFKPGRDASQICNIRSNPLFIIANRSLTYYRWINNYTKHLFVTRVQIGAQFLSLPTINYDYSAI